MNAQFQIHRTLALTNNNTKTVIAICLTNMVENSCIFLKLAKKTREDEKSCLAMCATRKVERDFSSLREMLNNEVDTAAQPIRLLWTITVRVRGHSRSSGPCHTHTHTR